MKKKHIYIIIVLLNFWSYSALSQISCTIPLPPELKLVSIQPETGISEFKWTSSLSSDVAAYLIYTYHNENGVPRGDIIDTIWDPTATSYNFNSTSYKYFSSSYVVAAYKLPISPGMDGCSSEFSNVLNTIFAKADIDTCNKKISVSWNSYPSFPVKVTGYSVLLSVNGGSYIELKNAGPGETSFTLNDFTIDAEHCFVVRANLEDGTISTSNKICLSTKMQRSPEWINADQATLNSDGKVALSFTIDPLSEMKHFNLERRIGTAGTFQEISQPVSVNGSVRFTDNQAEKNNINYYRLSAVNGCNLPVMVSNLASNIVLSLERSGENIILSWNPYKKWLGIISSYRLFVNTGKGYEEKADIPASDTIFVQGYQQIMYEVTGNQVCFYVMASEVSNPYGISGESLSSEICTNPTELITVPNVFTPNNDLDNDFFRPVLSFTPPEYHLIISNRQGNILFETRDYLTEWDGSQNGKPQPQGVYLWFLKLTTPSGKVISKTGTLTIIRNRQ